jgi:hypothetical protein
MKKKSETIQTEATPDKLPQKNSIWDLPQNVEVAPYCEPEAEHPTPPGTTYSIRIIEAFSGGSKYDDVSKIPPNLNTGYGPYQKKFVIPYQKPVFDNDDLYAKKTTSRSISPIDAGFMLRTDKKKKGEFSHEVEDICQKMNITDVEVKKKVEVVI